MLLKKSNICPICERAMERVIDMPRYPLTELYEPWSESFTEGRAVADQAFLFCSGCNHGKLEAVIPPEDLYGAGYRTKSAASIGSRTAIKNFSAFIYEHLSPDRRDTIIDIGGNDASLVNNFELERVIVDPNAQGEATLLRQFIEAADLEPWRSKAKLIVSSHTLEHIEDPHAFMRKVAGIMSVDDVLALQFPSLELLVSDARMEQIHHQHIHYYSERSISALLQQYGLEMVANEFDSDHYGALMVIAQKGKGEIDGARVSSQAIRSARAIYMASMTGCSALLRDREFIAFGAALMLPVFAYYLPELANAEYIADNDVSKDGLRYVNFNVPIRRNYDLKGRDVVITALNTKLAGRALTEIAFRNGARNVFIPTHSL